MKTVKMLLVAMLLLGAIFSMGLVDEDTPTPSPAVDDHLSMDNDVDPYGCPDCLEPGSPWDIYGPDYLDCKGDDDDDDDGFSEPVTKEVLGLAEAWCDRMIADTNTSCGNRRIFRAWKAYIILDKISYSSDPDGEGLYIDFLWDLVDAAREAGLEPVVR